VIRSKRELVRARRGSRFRGRTRGASFCSLQLTFVEGDRDARRTALFAASRKTQVRAPACLVRLTHEPPE